MTAPLILSISCADRPGIVARVTGFLADAGANVLEAQQFDDLESGRFFMRVVFDPDGASREALSAERAGLDLDALAEAFESVAEDDGASFEEVAVDLGVEDAGWVWCVL